LTRYGGQTLDLGYEEGAAQRTKVFDDIVGDLKIDTLYILDKSLLTTHHLCSVERCYNTKSLCILWRLNFKNKLI
jgi:hypothetical protein